MISAWCPGGCARSSARDIDVVRDARDGLEAVRMATELKPDVVLLDMRMPTINGVAATSAIREACPLTHVVILASVIDDAAVLDTVRAGHRLSAQGRQSGLHLGREKGHGRNAALLAASGVLMQQVHSRNATSRCRHNTEREVLRLLTHGKTNKQIALNLGIGDKSVKTYVSNILAKLNCQSRTEAAALATRMGLMTQHKIPLASFAWTGFPRASASRRPPRNAATAPGGASGRTLACSTPAAARTGDGRVKARGPRSGVDGFQHAAQRGGPERDPMRVPPWPPPPGPLSLATLHRHKVIVEMLLRRVLR